MTRNEMERCYDAIMSALRNHNIDVSHDTATTNQLTTFYFRDCCGGDIVDEALDYLIKNKK